MDSPDPIYCIADRTSLISLSEEDEYTPKNLNPDPHYPIIAKILWEKPINSNALKSTLTKSWGIPPHTHTNQLDKNTVAFLLDKEVDRTRILRNKPLVIPRKSYCPETMAPRGSPRQRGPHNISDLGTSV
ncbi:hypothetical protein Salat_1326000 [Sesamum alatum]|uniref:Uncharacterized protein n=1 Tax=Sesamum alatum TaxID=300844 RepID=A0AAE1YHP9_9LAMI|nr:hypothetical protein Salat_1326000 [Sesamum alatum]